MQNHPTIDVLKAELLNLLKEQFPGETALIQSVRGIEVTHWESKAYVYFIDGKSHDKKHEWHFQKNVMLQSKTFGTLVLDVLQGNRIGGVEFLDRLK